MMVKENNNFVIPNQQFEGKMKTAMVYFQFYAILLIVLSAIHVNMTRNQPVFDRIGPKFIFDSVIAIVWNNFVMFWL